MQHRRSCCCRAGSEPPRSFQSQQEWRNGCLSSRKLPLGAISYMPGNVYHVCGEHSRKLCESICIKAARFTSRRFQAVHSVRVLPIHAGGYSIAARRLKLFNITAFGKDFRLFWELQWRNLNFLLISGEACRRLRVTCIFRLKNFWLFFVWSARGGEDGKQFRATDWAPHFYDFYRLKNVEFERVIGSRWRRVFGKWQGSERIGTFSSLLGEA